MENLIKGVDVARYFLAKDPERKIFNTKVITRNHRDFYEGNARLNKYLHLAQNLWIAKTGQKLFSDDLYAYDNGGVVINVMENYSPIIHQNKIVDLPEEVANFLDKFYKAFKNASIDELIELSHEDSEWERKHSGWSKADQKMDSLSHADEYKEQYADMLHVMELMPL